MNTFARIIDDIAAAAASDDALFDRAEQIKAVMESDPANFSLSEFSWPSIYGE